MAVVEVAQGVPFTSITATLSIDGGTFDAPAPGSGVTMNSNTEIEVTLTTGQTQSSPFTFTLDSSADTTTLMSTSIESTPSIILDGPSYKGFTLAEIPDLMIQSGICGRTMAVQTAILGQIAATDDCMMVTIAQLQAIDGELDLSGQSIQTLQAGDFNSLTALESLNLSGNALTTLDATLFADLTALTTLDLSNNNFTTLPNIFTNLTNLTGVDVSGNPENNSDPFTLTVVATESSPGSAAIEVAQAAPFDVMATLSITGGNFSGNPSTTLILGKGTIRSVPVSYTVDTTLISATITVTISSPANDQIDGEYGIDPIDNEIRGYSGFQLAAGDPLLVLGNGICNRTPAVQTAILGQISRLTGPVEEDCAMVTLADLEEISFIILSVVPSLQAGDFAGLTEMTRLVLRNFALTTLPSGIFNGLTSLSTLTLRNSSLMTLDAEIFSGLTNLTNLNLSENNLDLTMLPAEIFSGLPNLTRVNLAINNAPLTLTVSLEATQDPSGTNPGMATLRALRGIEPFAVPFDITTTVSITGGEFPDSTSTVTIPKGTTQSDPFPFTIDQNATSSLVSFAISSPMNDQIDNDYDDGGYGGFHLVSGALLIFGTEDGICSRTPQIRDAILAQISAAENCLAVTNAHLNGIPMLTVGNQGITTLRTGDFAGLTEMTTLSLRLNNLEELPPGIFNDLTALTTLDLGVNDLEELPDGLFSDLTSLTALELDNNDLVALPAGIFSGLNALTRLNLESNDLEELPSGIFNGLTSLTTLLLSSNRLTELPPGIFNGLTNLTGVLATVNLTDPLPLTLTIQESSIGMAVIEIAPGIPFPSVMATLSIAGGTFDDPQTGSGVTRINDTQLQATITQGQTQSAPFTFTLNEPTPATPIPEAIISIITQPQTSIISDPQNIDVFNFETHTGYDGFTLVAGPALTSRLGICNRTQEIQNAILAQITETNDCMMVTTTQLQAITTLDLSGQSIQTLQVGDFASLTALTSLNLSGNALMTLPATIFADLIALTNLDLSNNNFPTLPNIFSNLTTLTGVDVSGNPQDDSPPFTSTVTLTSSSLSTVTLEIPQSLPFAVTATLSITGGDFSGAATTSVTIPQGNSQSPEVAYTQTTATVIEISAFTAPANVLNAFDGATGYSGFALASGPAFEFLTICGRTQQVQTEILRQINMDGVSGVMCDTVSTSQLAAITTLALNDPTPLSDGAPGDHIDITSLLSNDFAGLSGLLSLDLSHNSLPSLPSNIFNDLASLTSLNLSFNSLNTFDRNIFSRLTSLETLNLSGNGLTSLDPNPFANLNALTTLNLSDNSLTLDSNSFANLNALETLNLSTNTLTAFPEGIPSSIQTLNLSDNEFVRVPEGFFAGLTSLISVDLSFNRGRDDMGNLVFSPFILTITPTIVDTETTDAFIIQVVEGAPANLTATLSITGGTFSNGTDTITATIQTGNTQSARIPFTLDTGRTSAVITVAQTNTTPPGLLDDPNAGAYRGLSLEAGPSLTLGTGICSRTQGVQDGIISTLNALDLEGINNCRNVTIENLEEITTFSLSNSGLSSLKEGDFDGLTNLVTLDLTLNQLEVLPATIFDGLSTLSVLRLSLNELEILPPGLFSGLNSLTSATFSGNPGADFPLTLTLKSVGTDQFVVEIVEGAPIDVMATVTISGGTFPASEETPPNTIAVTLETGMIQSAPITFAYDSGATTANLSLTLTSSLGSAYQGLTLAAGPALPIGQGICGRTDQVQTAILDQIAGVSSCAQVTPSQLTTITTLNLSDPTPDDASTDTNGDTINDDMDDITELLAEDFIGLTSLTSLNLSGNGLTGLPEQVFSPLSTLTDLNLSGNALSGLHHRVFLSLSMLTNLDLSGNMLASLSLQIFSSLSGLTNLDLSGNALTDESALALLPLRALITLDASNNAFTALPDGAFTVVPVQGVDLSGNNPSVRPSDGSANFALRMSPQQINLEREPDDPYQFVIGIRQGAPIDIEIAVSLTGGTFSNGMTETEVTISQLMSQSEILEVTPTYAESTEITLTTTTTTSLSPFDPNTGVGYSGLAIVGETLSLQFGVCDRSEPVSTAILLAVIISGQSVSDCSDVTINENDGRNDLRMLTSLVLSGSISSLRSGDFLGLSMVTTLDLSGLGLESLPDDVFMGLDALTTLDLSNNQLTSIDTLSFPNTLTELDLSGNELGSLTSNIFSTLTALTDLDLSDNELTDLPDGLFSGLTALVGADLSGNPASGTPSPFTLTLTPREGLTQNTFIIEVIEGAPTELTATVEIRGGTFVNGTTETEVTLSKGMTESAPIELVIPAEEIATVITVTQSASDPSDLLNGYLLFSVSDSVVTGYSGLELAEGEPLVLGDGICNRTPQVQAAILEEINSAVPDPLVTCSTVVTADLATITELDVSDPTPNNDPADDIMTLQEGDFVGLGMLTSLDLSDNMLEGLPNRVFSSLSMLTSLDVSDNALTDLPDGLFSGLTALTGADFSGNTGADFTLILTLKATSLTEFVIEVVEGAPADLMATVMITGGTLSYNATTNATSVEVTLAVGRTQSDLITVTPDPNGSPTLMVTTSQTFPAFNGNTGYSGLAIEASEQSFQSGICNRTQQVQDAILVALSMSDCAAVTAALLAGITGTLDLENESIASLMDDDFADLTALTELNLTNTGLSTLTLPAGVFSDLTALERLFLSGNPQLTQLPAGILSGLTRLTTLELLNNGLTDLSPQIFSDLTALESLILSGNQLTTPTLPTGIFSGLTDLTVLGLGENQLTTLDANIFSDLENLTTLDLSSNQLSDLPPAIFSGFGNANFNGLTSLTTLDLNSNQLMALPERIFSGLSMLQGVDLSMNPSADPADFTLTLTPKQAGGSTFVIEVVEGAPTDLTATVMIQGGTVMDRNGVTTSTAELTVETGMTESTPLMVAATSPDRNVIIAIRVDTVASAYDSNTGMGYSGLAFASGADLTLITGICGRTDAVEMEILSQINAMLSVGEDPVTCGDVTNTDLMGITGTLNLSSQNIETLLPGDFAGLTGLRVLDLFDNDLEVEDLHEGIFSDLNALIALDLSGNGLTMLPEGIFSGLTMLQGVNVSDNTDDMGNDTSPFTLTLFLNQRGNNFVVEVAEGAPTDLTVNIMVVGGTASSTTATIETGMTESEVIMVTPAEETMELTVTLTNPVPDLSLSPNYSGLVIGASSDPLTFTFGTSGICNRTQQVQDVILNAINAMDGVSDVTCETATADQLAGITATLTLSGLTEELQVGDFEGLSGVTELVLLLNTFTSLPNGVFSGLSGLESLLMGLHRNLTSLPNGIFSDLTSLVSLNLATNALMSVSQDLFAGLTSLTYLELGVNQLSGLDANTFSSLSGLTRLGLTSNNLASLDGDAFAGLSALETLDLSGNDLMSLPEGIFSGLSMLRGVDLSGNPSADPADFTLTMTARATGGSTFVVEVVEGAPIDLTATVTIQGGSFASGLTTSTVTLTRGMTESTPLMVTATSPDGNVIISVRVDTVASAYDPDTRIGYSGLAFASGDDLTLITGICSRTDQVEDAILDALGGSIACEDVMTSDLLQVPALNLSSGGISSLQEGDFLGLRELTNLNLSGNTLTGLPSGVFSDLIELETLDLNGNGLMSLPEGVFSELSALTSLDVSDNDLMSLPEGIFSGLTMLMGVDVSGNPDNNSDPFTLTLVLRETGMDSFVIEVAEGAPTRLTATVTIEGGTDMNGETTAEIVIRTGMTESEGITIMPDEESTEVTVTLTNLMPDLTMTPFNINNDGMGYSGLVIEASDVLRLIFGVEERIEEAGESILPTVSRELISGIQNVVSGRIGRLATNPVIAPPTAQVAGQSSLSDLLTFTAQTFDRVHNQEQSFAIETLLQETSFTLSLNGEEGETSRTGFKSLAVWGSADYQNLSGGDDVSWDGSITSLHIGSDLRVTREVLAGISVSWSQGAFDYEDSTSGVSQEGEYELELLSVHPYGGWSPVPWFNLWATGGYGFGEVTVKDNMMTGSQSSDVQSYSGSLGASAERDLEENSVFPGITTLRVKGQTSIAMMEVEDNGQMISSLTTEAYQQRVSVEVSHTCVVCENRYLIPTLEIGVRNDGGDGETGNGLEIGGDVEYRATDLGLRISVNGRWLAVHSGELEEWGVGGSIRFEPGAGAGEGQGFWMSITPEWGETGSRARELWDAKIENVERASQEREVRLGAEAGYGLGIGKALLTPSAGVSLTNQGYRSYRVGSGVVMGEFSLTLEGERRSTRSVSEEESVRLEGSLRF